MEVVKIISVSLFSITTLLFLSSQCENYAIKKGEELVNLLFKDKHI